MLALVAESYSSDEGHRLGAGGLGVAIQIAPHLSQFLTRCSKTDQFSVRQNVALEGGHDIAATV